MVIIYIEAPMSDFWLFIKLGLEHVLDWTAYDHILFLVVLSVSYSINLWRQLLLLVTFFTIGHSISLLVANYNLVSVSITWIEFLIPITILVAAIFNLFAAGKKKQIEKAGVFYVVTIFFGLIHGFGFAVYYKMIIEGNEIAPLLEFALGVELSQIIVVLFVMAAAFIFQRVFHFGKRDWVLVVSSIVIGLVIPMLIEKWPL